MVYRYVRIKKILISKHIKNGKLPMDAHISFIIFVIKVINVWNKNNGWNYFRQIILSNNNSIKHISRCIMKQ